MNTTIKIKEKVINNVLDTLIILPVRLNLNDSAEISACVTSETGEGQYSLTYTLTEAEYAAWGNDDDYIINLVMEKMNVEKA